MRRITMATTAAFVLVLGASASAQDATITGGVLPNTAASASRVHVQVAGTAPELAGALPDSIALGVQRGFALDTRAVAERCGGQAATTGACPAASRIGLGQAIVHVSGFVNQDVPATIDVFLADPVQAGDVASAVVLVSGAGLSRAVRTRLLAPATGPVGYELRLEGIAGAVPTVPGVTLTLQSLTLDIGALRKVTKTTTKRVHVRRNGRRVTVKRKVKRRVTYTLLRNPKTCGGAWAVRLTISAGGADHVRDIAIPCAAG